MNDLQDVEGQNFCRLALLITDVGTHTLQSLFEKEYSATCDLQTFLNSKTHTLNKLYRQKVINQSQKELLLPSNGTIPVLKTFDIQLVSTLLANLCSIAQPLNGWALAPAANDISTGADVLRLRKARNEFYAHGAQSSMADATFQKEWKGIVNVVSRLSMLLEIDKQNEIKDAIAEIERTDITWKRKTEISKQLFQNPHCEILQTLEAIEPDTLEVICSDEVKEAANAEIPQGEDGIICVLKEYPKLKSDIPKNSAVEIAEHMFKNKLLNMDQYDKIMDPSSNRRVCIDRLLKVVVNGTSEQRECFFNNLKEDKDCSSLAIALSSRRVTEDDRNKFRQVAERYVPDVINITTLTNRFDEEDIKFFQDHLFDDLEDVDRINDELLSQFFIKIVEHSRIAYCKDPIDMIHTLFNTMQSCHLQVESVLQNTLPSALFNKWTNFRNKVEERNLSLGTSRGEQSGDQSTSRSFLQWMHSAAMRVLTPFCEYFRMRFISAKEGSITLTFGATKDFSVRLLDQSKMEILLEKLLRIFCFESKIKVDGSVYVTVYRVAPGNDGTEEYIQFHLDFEACHGGQRETKGNLERHERKLLVEELNPSQLQRWIVDQPNIRTDIKEEMGDIVSRTGLSRQEKMESLLNIIIKLENCGEILKRFCEKNDRYVYEKMFRQSDEMPSQREIGLSPNLSYNKGGGLQKLYSMWININDDQGPVKGDSEADSWLTAKVRENDQIEKDILADEGKKNKSCNIGYLTSARHLDYVAGKLGMEWFSIALQLGLTLAEIQQIQMNQQGNVRCQILTALTTWSHRSDKDDRGKVLELVDALNEVQRNDLANELKTDLSDLAETSPKGNEGASMKPVKTKCILL